MIFLSNFHLLLLLKYRPWIHFLQLGFDRMKPFLPLISTSNHNDPIQAKQNESWNLQIQFSTHPSTYLNATSQVVGQGWELAGYLRNTLADTFFYFIQIGRLKQHKQSEKKCWRQSSENFKYLDVVRGWRRRISSGLGVTRSEIIRWWNSRRSFKTRQVRASFVLQNKTFFKKQISKFK